MVGQAQQATRGEVISDPLLALVDAEGTAGHTHPASDVLSRGPTSARDLADIVHYLCILHGRHPGLIDHAIGHTPDCAARNFLMVQGDAFGRERTLLTRLVVAAGPIPSTPGQADAESAILAQRHALEMLAQSDRNGTALGAALALIADWHAIRQVLERAAQRLGIETLPCALADRTAIGAVLDQADISSATERALIFGAQQIVAQHRGLWDLLAVRAIARQD